MAKRKVHIVTYTHWDREFRWEFERTRMRLVDCIDRLLEIMEQNPDFRSFLMDGQVTLLEDYLEIRPEKRETIEKLAREGRLETGPWYTLADCAPVQGESIVRNLVYGTSMTPNSSLRCIIRLPLNGVKLLKRILICLQLKNCFILLSKTLTARL